MVLNLILDGNYILSKLVYTLHKNNLLYGNLNKSMEMAVNNYKRLYPFANVYLVSDSKEKSWRKDVYNEYKANRKKDSNIDWEYVHTAYDEFKESIKSKHVKVMEYSKIEGDDWISFLVHKSNLQNKSTLIISNDYDIKQLINYSIDPLIINMMSNEMASRHKIFLPRNYKIFLDKVNNMNNDDIFNLNDNTEFIKMIGLFNERYEVSEIDSNYSLLVKLISGDRGDNISSVHQTMVNNKKRGIGEKGAETIINTYLSEFGHVNTIDKDLIENMADIICEKRKLHKGSIDAIIENINNNLCIISLELNNLPSHIINKMENIYGNL